MPLKIEDILSARAQLRGVAHVTPIMHSRTLDQRAGRRVLLKCENFQRAGSFKFRGAYNTISRLPPAAARAGVVAFSSGNHAQGVALAAQLCGIAALICMPDDAPAVKVAATAGYGAEIVRYERLTTDREAFARAYVEQRGASLIPPFDHEQIIAGQGTLAYELLDQYPDLEALLVPVGGGGLISGCAIAAHALRPSLRVFGVEPEDGDDVRRSLAAGQRVRVAPPRSVADGLRTESPGQLTFPLIQQHVEAILTVSDAEIMAALHFALTYLKLVIEPSGAATLAAVLFGKLPTQLGTVGVVLSGGNLDPGLLAQVAANAAFA